MARMDSIGRLEGRLTKSSYAAEMVSCLIFTPLRLCTMYFQGKYFLIFWICLIDTKIKSRFRFWESSGNTIAFDLAKRGNWYRSLSLTKSFFSYQSRRKKCLSPFNIFPLFHLIMQTFPVVEGAPLMIIGHILDKDESNFLPIKLTRANVPEPTHWNRCRAPQSQHFQRLQPPLLA
jgi:hypothetical protein